MGFFRCPMGSNDILSSDYHIPYFNATVPRRVVSGKSRSPADGQRSCCWCKTGLQRRNAAITACLESSACRGLAWGGNRWEYQPRPGARMSMSQQQMLRDMNSIHDIEKPSLTTKQFSQDPFGQLQRPLVGSRGPSFASETPG